MKPYIALAALLALATHAAAQQPAAVPNPTDPAAPVPAVKYDSAFSGYRGFREEPLAPWRGVNDEVARVGGHVGIVGGAEHHAPAGGKPEAKSPPPAGGSTPGSIRK